MSLAPNAYLLTISHERTHKTNFSTTYSAIKVGFKLLVKARDAIAKALEFWDDEIIAENLGNKREVSSDGVAELLEIQHQTLQCSIGLVLEGFESLDHLCQARIRQGSNPGSINLLHMNNETHVIAKWGFVSRKSCFCFV